MGAACVLTAAALAGCPASDDATGDGDGTGTAGTSAGPGNASTLPATSTAAETGTGAGSGDDTSGTPPATGDASGDETTAGNPPGNDDSGVVPDGETPCGGMVHACGDQMDNDGDGFFDLFDPECTGPCDDDEGSFQTGLPGDNVDCIQDCFFDGNSGQGDDGCFWDLTCDPANPGGNLEGINCEYDDSPACGNLPHDERSCANFCGQFTPPGCDCFGCCTVVLDDGSTVDIFLNSGPDCALDNIEACASCTSQAEDCGNPCEPGTCELCFGQTDADLPPECDDNECTSGEPCEAAADCPTDYYCLSNCCYPPPPG